MMPRFVIRLTVMVLAGIVFLGLGGIRPGPAPRPAGEGLAAPFAGIGQMAVSLLAPGSAEAAVTKCATKKKVERHQATKARTKKSKATLAKRKLAKHPLAKKKRTSKALVLKQRKTRTRKRVAGKVKTKRRQVVSGRCEPQSLTYARERSGIMRSRTGRENGPITWFASEKRLGKTSGQPTPGSVLILGADKRHGMSTGHVAYVEKAIPEGHSRYKVVFSHTNYDRQCSLETNIVALYDSKAMTLDISSGAWQPWGRGLRVAGFIQQE